MREPIVYFGIGFLLAALLILGARVLARSRVGRLARKRLESAAPNLMADIEADMGELHAQIAVATRRLETSVEQMRSKTCSQLSEIGERSVALGALTAKERSLSEQLHVTEAEFAVKAAALAEVEHKLAQEKAE